MKSKNGFTVGDVVDVKTSHMKEWRQGRIVGFGSWKNPNSVRIILDGGKTPYTIHSSFIARAITK